MHGAEIMVRHKLTNQRKAFARKSLEHDCMLIRSDGYLGEFTAPI